MKRFWEWLERGEDTYMEPRQRDPSKEESG
jgi:hypothetical protein